MQGVNFSFGSMLWRKYRFYLLFCLLDCPSFSSFQPVHLFVGLPSFLLLYNIPSFLFLYGLLWFTLQTTGLVLHVLSEPGFCAQNWVCPSSFSVILCVVWFGFGTSVTTQWFLQQLSRSWEHSNYIKNIYNFPVAPFSPSRAWEDTF